MDGRESKIATQLTLKLERSAFAGCNLPSCLSNPVESDGHLLYIATGDTICYKVYVVAEIYEVESCL